MSFIDKLNYKKIFLVAVIATILYLGLKLYNSTNLFVDTSLTKNNYLSFNDYQLYDYESNDLETNPLNIFYRYKSDHLYGNGEPEYKTSKNFHVGQTWDEFLNIYGDYYAKTFSAYEDNYEGERSEGYYSTHYVYEEMKVNEYNEKYIESGTIDPSKNDITVIFEMYIKGKEIAYTESGEDELRHEYYSSSLPEGTIFNPRIQTYGLSFQFQEKDGKLICTTIYTDRYVTGD